MNGPTSRHWRERLRPHRDTWTAWALFVGGFTVLAATQRAVGFVRDESVYFAAAESYADWFKLLLQRPTVAFSDAAIVRAWDFNHEHPALMKSLFGLSHALFHESLGWLSPAAAFRVPAFAVAALIPVLIYRFGLEIYDRRVGLIAALSFFLVPRQFFNSHLAAFDIPIAAAWLFVVYAFHRGLRSERWALLTGVGFGLALATKHNALFLPFVLGPFALWQALAASGLEGRARSRVWQLIGVYAALALGMGILWMVYGPKGFQARLQPLSPAVTLVVAFAMGSGWLLSRLRIESPEAYRPLLAITAMALLGPVIFYLHWPYLWHQPVERTAWYLAFHAKHNHYAWFYLGELLRLPPFPLAYVVVKTALTVPTSLFVPMVTGLLALSGRMVATLFVRTRGRVTPPSMGELLVGANAVASILIISHPQVPHFGGVKHWFPSMPFLALLGAVAVVRAAEALRTWLPSRLSDRVGPLVWVTGLAGLLFVPALWGSIRIHPYGTSAYSELAGGLPGAATLGMQRQFWSNNVTGVLPWINEHAPRGARLYLHEVNGYSFRDYQANRLLRPDLRAVGSPANADIVAYQYHQEFREHEFNVWQAFGTTKPVTGLYLDETPQVVVYARPGLIR